MSCKAHSVKMLSSFISGLLCRKFCMFNKQNKTRQMAIVKFNIFMCLCASTGNYL